MLGPDRDESLERERGASRSAGIALALGLTLTLTLALADSYSYRPIVPSGRAATLPSFLLSGRAIVHAVPQVQFGMPSAPSEPPERPTLVSIPRGQVGLSRYCAPRLQACSPPPPCPSVPISPPGILARSWCCCRRTQPCSSTPTECQSQRARPHAAR